MALIIESQVAPRRRMLEGVASYMQAHGLWDIYLKPFAVDSSFPEWVRSWDGDGIIAAIWASDVQNVLPAGIPVVDMVGVLPGLPLVHTHDRSVGRMGADHLLERGYHHFAFVGYENPWSRQRREGFEQRVIESGRTSSVREFVQTKTEPGPRPWEQQQARIASWVRSLTKPVGVMTATDLLGQQFLEACSRAEFAVPEQVAVIGADNDELICAVANPPLSSVIINDFQRGYQAALLLDKLMNGQPAPGEPVWVEPAGVVSRASTDILAIADQMVADALRFIRNHACDGISVVDVVDQVPLSRSMLERRFRTCAGRSINDEIIRVRLNRAIEMLGGTDLELKTIAPRAGFKDASYMGAVFRARLGRSPGSYRKGVKNSGT